MNIIYSSHALMKMVQRDIDKIDVENILNNPIEIMREGDIFKCFGLVYNKEPKYLLVIYAFQTKDMVKVITVYRVSKGGLIKYGFHL